MTLDEARKIVKIWGDYLEVCGARLVALFVANIPKSLLPFPVETLEEALNVVAGHYHDLGDYEAAGIINESFRHLALYSDDDTALQGAAVKFGDPRIRNTIAAKLNDVQNAEFGANLYKPTPAELAGIERGIRDAADGKFATDEQVKAVFAKHRRL